MSMHGGYTRELYTFAVSIRGRVYAPQHVGLFDDATHSFAAGLATRTPRSTITLSVLRRIQSPDERERWSLSLSIARNVSLAASINYAMNRAIPDSSVLTFVPFRTSISLNYAITRVVSVPLSQNHSNFETERSG